MPKLHAPSVSGFTLSFEDEALLRWGDLEDVKTRLKTLLSGNPLPDEGLRKIARVLSNRWVRDLREILDCFQLGHETKIRFSAYLILEAGQIRDEILTGVRDRDVQDVLRLVLEENPEIIYRNLNRLKKNWIRTLRLDELWTRLDEGLEWCKVEDLSPFPWRRFRLVRHAIEKVEREFISETNNQNFSPVELFEFMVHRYPTFTANHLNYLLRHPTHEYFPGIIALSEKFQSVVANLKLLRRLPSQVVAEILIRGLKHCPYSSLRSLTKLKLSERDKWKIVFRASQTCPRELLFFFRRLKLPAQSRSYLMLESIKNGGSADALDEILIEEYSQNRFEFIKLCCAYPTREFCEKFHFVADLFPDKAANLLVRMIKNKPEMIAYLTEYLSLLSIPQHEAVARILVDKRCVPRQLFTEDEKRGLVCRLRVSENTQKKLLLIRANLDPEWAIGIASHVLNFPEEFQVKFFKTVTKSILQRISISASSVDAQRFKDIVLNLPVKIQNIVVEEWLNNCDKSQVDFFLRLPQFDISNLPETFGDIVSRRWPDKALEYLQKAKTVDEEKRWLESLSRTSVEKLLAYIEEKKHGRLDFRYLSQEEAIKTILSQANYGRIIEFFEQFEPTSVLYSHDTLCLLHGAAVESIKRGRYDKLGQASWFALASRDTELYLRTLTNGNLSEEATYNAVLVGFKFFNSFYVNFDDFRRAVTCAFNGLRKNSKVKLLREIIAIGLVKFLPERVIDLMIELARSQFSVSRVVKLIDKKNLKEEIEPRLILKCLSLAKTEEDFISLDTLISELHGYFSSDYIGEACSVFSKADERNKRLVAKVLLKHFPSIQLFETVENSLGRNSFNSLLIEVAPFVSRTSKFLDALLQAWERELVTEEVLTLSVRNLIKQDETLLLHPHAVNIPENLFNSIISDAFLPIEEKIIALAYRYRRIQPADENFVMQISSDLAKEIIPEGKFQHTENSDLNSLISRFQFVVDEAAFLNETRLKQEVGRFIELLREVHSTRARQLLILNLVAESHGLVLFSLTPDERSQLDKHILSSIFLSLNSQARERFLASVKLFNVSDDEILEFTLLYVKHAQDPDPDVVLNALEDLSIPYDQIFEPLNLLISKAPYRTFKCLREKSFPRLSGFFEDGAVQKLLSFLTKKGRLSACLALNSIAGDEDELVIGGKRFSKNDLTKVRRLVFTEWLLNGNGSIVPFFCLNVDELRECFESIKAEWMASPNSPAILAQVHHLLNDEELFEFLKAGIGNRTIEYLQFLISGEESDFLQRARKLVYSQRAWLIVVALESGDVNLLEHLLEIFVAFKGEYPTTPKILDEWHRIGRELVSTSSGTLQHAWQAYRFHHLIAELALNRILPTPRILAALPYFENRRRLFREIVSQTGVRFFETVISAVTDYLASQIFEDSVEKILSRLEDPLFMLLKSRFRSISRRILEIFVCEYEKSIKSAEMFLEKLRAISEAILQGDEIDENDELVSQILPELIHAAYRPMHTVGEVELFLTRVEDHSDHLTVLKSNQRNWTIRPRLAEIKRMNFKLPQLDQMLEKLFVAEAALYDQLVQASGVSDSVQIDPDLLRPILHRFMRQLVVGGGLSSEDDKYKFIVAVCSFSRLNAFQKLKNRYKELRHSDSMSPSECYELLELLDNLIGEITHSFQGVLINDDAPALLDLLQDLYPSVFSLSRDTQGLDGQKNSDSKPDDKFEEGRLVSERKRLDKIRSMIKKDEVTRDDLVDFHVREFSVKVLGDAQKFIRKKHELIQIQSEELELELVLTKSKPSYFSRSSAGLCTADDSYSWNDPNYLQMNIVDRSRSQIVGNIQLHLFELDGKPCVLARINPTEGLLRFCDHRSLAFEIMRALHEFADANGLVLYLPRDTSWHELTNRTSFAPFLQEFYDPSGPIRCQIRISSTRVVEEIYRARRITDFTQQDSFLLKSR
ncbi:MAG: hypothetical protein N2654_06495 [Deltaproteobacteria bacterium]|nr:hypothetical protein [Deltaproteobacteria bacterium]